MRPLSGFVGFNHREYKPEVLDDFLRRVKIGKEHPREMFLSLADFRKALDGELMAYTSDVQNGRWLPGVSPREVWENGIGQYPGVAARPLRKLAPTARHLLSTHWRKVDVGAQGIRFEVGGRELVFWGDELLPWKHKALPVRWNIEEPELLHCLPPGGAPFTLTLMEIGSSTAPISDLNRIGGGRKRWVAQGKAVHDNLTHLVSQVVCDTEHSPRIHAEGEAIALATEGHRAHKEAVVKQTKRLASLAGALGIPDGVKDRERAIAAAQRLRALLATEAGVEL
jgi:hypothetical protein